MGIVEADSLSSSRPSGVVSPNELFSSLGWSKRRPERKKELFLTCSALKVLAVLCETDQHCQLSNGILTPIPQVNLLEGHEMSDRNKSFLASLLIVDDEPSIRYSLSCVLTEIGYHVRSAEDGLSALLEIGNEAPEILLSDLHMPGMSGFELLSEVRRRFPAIQTIAMSGAFLGDEVPSGIAADGFYQKGSSMGSLLRIMGGLPRRDRMSAQILQVSSREPITASLLQLVH